MLSSANALNLDETKMSLIGSTLALVKILDSSKLKEFADDNFRSDGNGINFSYRPENTVGKGEIPR